MNWPIAAGAAQLTLIALFLAAHLRAGRRPIGQLLVYAVPMTALAVATLAGGTWAPAVAGVFYAVWLVNHALSWLRPDPARLPIQARAAVGLLSLAVLTLTWIAVAATPVHPVA